MDVLKIFEERFIPFGQVCDSIAEGVCIAGANFDFIFWNESAKKILFDEPDSTHQSRWASRYGLFYPDNGELLRYEDLPMVKALNGESFSDYQIVSKNPRNPDGYILSVNGRPIRNGEATVGGITTFRDITKSVNVEKALATERVLYKNILDLMPGIVFIKDLEGKFLYGNKGFHELLHAEDIVGRNTEDFVAQDMAARIKESDQQVLMSREPGRFEEVIFWKDGSRSIFNTTRFPYYNSDGVINGVCAVAHDVTREVDDRIQLEEEKQKSIHNSKLAALGTLAAEIAHEIRNPLTVLVGSTKIIQGIIEKNLPEKAELLRQLEVMNQTVFRMNEVIQSLNSLSKNSSLSETTSFKIQEMLHDIQVISAYRIKTSKIKFDVEYPKGDPGYFCGNQIQISEVVLNLVTNAFDAVENTRDARVWIKVWTEEHQVIMEFHDSGPGVGVEHRNKIFEPYYTTKPGRKGTGLGLSISSKIVNQHNGTLDYVNSDEGHFFLVKLPLQSSGA